jgi:uncharacterized membrane protein YfhO
VEGGYLATGYDVRFPDYELADEPPGEVLRVERQGEDFRAEVRVDRPAHLVLKMSYHPGWRVAVDGQRVESVHLMPSFVGVSLEPGTHEVSFRYDPGPLKGILVVLGILIVTAFSLWDWRISSSMR